MLKPVVSGGPVLSRVMLVGQAPGIREPVAGHPFAWTAGKTMFKWFEEACGLDEQSFRRHIYMAAVCRCFPGRNPGGGDRVPSPSEVENCSSWMEQEIEILHPGLIIPVGKLAISQFLPLDRLDAVIGQMFTLTRQEQTFDLIPLPHPSGASPWHRMEPGKTLLKKAMNRIISHPVFVAKVLEKVKRAGT